MRMVGFRFANEKNKNRKKDNYNYDENVYESYAV